MICQYCGKREADTHIKRIVNGAAKEMHLCHMCAAKNGYGQGFGSVGLDLNDLFGGLFGELPSVRNAAPVIQCPGCGATFEDIAKSGTVGCAECYRTFYDRLLPSVRRIHGNTSHQGKAPRALHPERGAEDRLAALKEELAKAVEAQDYERAAVLRDEIKRSEG